MIVINRKRIQIIVSCVLIAMFAFSFQMAANQKELEKDRNLQQQKSSTVLTTATPASGKTIVIDARSWSSRETELLINPNQIITDLIQFKESV